MICTFKLLANRTFSTSTVQNTKFQVTTKIYPMNCLLSILTHPEVQWFSIFYRCLVFVDACPFVKKAKHPSLSILYLPLMKMTNIGKGSISPRTGRNNVFVTCFHEFRIYEFFSRNFQYFLLKQGRKQEVFCGKILQIRNSGKDVTNTLKVATVRQKLRSSNNTFISE